MNNPDTQKPTWLNHLDKIILATTAIISFVVAILDFLGVLDSIPWLAARVPILTLLLSGSIAIYLILERRNQLEVMQKDVQYRMDDLENKILESSIGIINSLQGLEFKKFNSANEVMSYVNKRLSQAQKQIDDLSWRPSVNMGFAVYSPELDTENIDQVTKITQRVPYREIFMFNRSDRLPRLKGLLEQDLPGYSCVYYESDSVPLLQFMVIDKEEVIILSEPLKSKVAIKHPDIVQLFCEYYDEIWHNATPIKLGTSLHQETIEKLFTKHLAQN